tara:strand:- start:1542 stop:4025 length:2484 start_codon:yes stop_codon:yes gene_type:complete
MWIYKGIYSKLWQNNFMAKESKSRIIINDMLRQSGWILEDQEKPNVITELSNKSGSADYVMLDKNNYHLCTLEAKKELINPLSAKKQAKKYAKTLNCPFVILSNGVNHYLWDIRYGNPQPIDKFPSQEKLIQCRDTFKPDISNNEKIDKDYIALSIMSNFSEQVDFIDETTREDFISKNKLKFLRDYQLDALHAVKKSIKEGQTRFLLEMATGTGKTLTSAAIIKMFFRLFNVKRVLFLVDRVELEEQTESSFSSMLKNDFKTLIWKENKDSWRNAKIVVSTIQSFIRKNKFEKIFTHNDFDLVISDESHRSLGLVQKRVFEYFNGFKLGLTATPRNFLKSVNTNSLLTTDPKQLEERLQKDTYTTFGCSEGTPTYRYSLEDGVKEGYLINPRVIKATTELTTQMLSEKGLIFQTQDSEGNDIDSIFKRSDFEKKFFSADTNKMFCKIFMEHAKKDPVTKEIGKTLIFCASQDHASRVTQILNEMAHKKFPNLYNSDFAEQVTSFVINSQEMTVNFSNLRNSLNGNSKFDENYKSSKTRVCVTVGMMTTGYDCEDILNICLMRPIFSPTDFIQMKGRGTRTFDFKECIKIKNESHNSLNTKKDTFFLFDFMGNYEFFEHDYQYDEILPLPTVGGGEGNETRVIDETKTNQRDPIESIVEIELGKGVMKIDRDLYPKFSEKVRDNAAIRDNITKMNFEKAEELLDREFLTKNDQYSLHRLQESIGVDRRISKRELLLFIFGHIDHIKTKNEYLDDSFYDFSIKNDIDEMEFDAAKDLFISCYESVDYRETIKNKEFGKLFNHPLGTESIGKVSPELLNKIPQMVETLV